MAKIDIYTRQLREGSNTIAKCAEQIGRILIRLEGQGKPPRVDAEALYSVIGKAELAIKKMLNAEPPALFNKHRKSTKAGVGHFRKGIVYLKRYIETGDERQSKKAALEWGKAYGILTRGVCDLNRDLGT